MRATIVVLLTALGVAWGGSAFADGDSETEPDYSFNAIVALSGCSASVFRMEGQPPTDDALVLTNGHCIGFMDEYEVLVGEPTNRGVEIFDDRGTVVLSTTASEIVYATMHKTDFAVLRLDVTYQQLLDEYGVQALLLATGPGVVGEDIVVVSGYWEYVAACQLDGFVYSMKESHFTWWDSLRFTSECETFGGTSGSPVISTATGEIIGVNNTGYEGGEACTRNNPCEVDEQGGVTTLEGGAYGQQTWWLYTCVDADFALDLDREDCSLPRPSAVLRMPGFDVATDVDCDADGNLDTGETAFVTVQLENEGPVPLTAVEVTLSASSDSLQILEPMPLVLDSIDGFGTVAVELAVALAPDLTDIELIELDVAAWSADSIAPEVAVSSPLRVNFDDVLNSAAIDDAESNAVAWELTSGMEGSTADWVRRADPEDAANTVWRAIGVGAYGDQRMISPLLEVGEGALTVTFSHRYRFETSSATFWDGAVIELSADGVTWQDAADLGADPGYGGVITDESGNPLADRLAYVDTSPAWPDHAQTTLDFGTQFAGQSVRLRFRVGTDAAAGDFGWEVDDIAIAGLTNLPFSSVQPNTCGGEEPVAPPPVVEPPTDDGCACSAGGPRSTGWAALVLLAGIVRRRQRR